LMMLDSRLRVVSLGDAGFELFTKNEKKQAFQKKKGRKKKEEKKAIKPTK
jgi:hypothetical protein